MSVDNRIIVWRARSLAIAAGLAAALGVPPGVAAQDGLPPVTFEQLDSRFEAIVPQRARVEVVASGFSWVEGPAWDRRGKRLLFSDIPNNSVLEWREGQAPRLFLRPSGYTGSAAFAGPEPGSNGLYFDAAGRLLLCQHGDRRIARLESDGRFTTLVERYQGKRINSPNDLVLKSNGDLFFTDPPFGLPKQLEDPNQEQEVNGVYCLSTAGLVTLLTKEVRFPNGIGFAPDEKTLYVSDADAKHPRWFAFEVKADGTLGAARVFADGAAWVGNGPGVADGLEVDAAGNVFGTGPGGIYVFSPRGELLGRIATGVKTANLEWGDDGSTLYITADTTIRRVRLRTRGKGF
jgi:gluconolactonase